MIKFKHKLYTERDTYVIPNKSFKISNNPTTIDYIDKNTGLEYHSGIYDAGINNIITKEQLKQLGY